MIDFLLRGHFVISSIYDSYPFVILSQLLTQEEITDLIEKNSKNIMDNFKKEIQKSDDFRVVLNVLSNHITKVIRSVLETELKVEAEGIVDLQIQIMELLAMFSKLF